MYTNTQQLHFMYCKHLLLRLPLTMFIKGVPFLVGFAATHSQGSSQYNNNKQNQLSCVKCFVGVVPMYQLYQLVGVRWLDLLPGKQSVDSLTQSVTLKSNKCETECEINVVVNQIMSIM